MWRTMVHNIKTFIKLQYPIYCKQRMWGPTNQSTHVKTNLLNNKVFKLKYCILKNIPQSCPIQPL